MEKSKEKSIPQCQSCGRTAKKVRKTKNERIHHSLLDEQKYNEKAYEKEVYLVNEGFVYDTMIETREHK